MEFNRFVLGISLLVSLGTTAACGGGGGGGGGGSASNSPTPTPGTTGSVEVILDRAPGSSLQIFSVVASVGSRSLRATDDRSVQHLIGLLPVGDQVVETADPTEGCRIESDTQTTVTVVAGTTSVVRFRFSCRFTPESRITFGADLEGSGVAGVWTIRPDGTALREVSPVSGINPSLSPDGTRVAFFVVGHGNWLANVDGSDARVFLPAGGWQATWSPDGTELVVLSTSDSGARDLWRVSADGAQVQRITNDSDTEWNAAWSPDGAMLAIVKNQELQLIDTNGSFLMSLGGGLDSSWPRWSPDGSRLVFAWNEPGEEPEFQIWTVNVDGSNRTQLTAMDMPCGGQTFSPDGSEIIFHCDGWIWRMNADGTNQRIFTEMPGPGVTGGIDWVGA